MLVMFVTTVLEVTARKFGMSNNKVGVLLKKFNDQIKNLLL